MKQYMGIGAGVGVCYIGYTVVSDNRNELEA